MGRLSGKAIVVTGASRGLGEAMALGYAAQSATLVLGARTAADLARVAKACRAAGAEMVTECRTDIADEAQVRRLVDEAMRAHGRIDGFVANAGIGPASLGGENVLSLVAHERHVVQGIVATNLIGTWLCLRWAAPVMKRGSSFIVIGSSTGRKAFPGAGMYGITKAALDTLTRIAAQELGAGGIRVNCLSPGGMVDTAFFGPEGMPSALKRYTDGATPDLMVPAAIWLASDESVDVNGAFVLAREFNRSGPSGVRVALASG